MAPTISLYQHSGDPERGPEHTAMALGAWIDMQEFCSEELNELFTAWSEGRTYYGGGGASAEWAVKLYEPYDEDWDPWSSEVPGTALED